MTEFRLSRSDSYFSASITSDQEFLRTRRFSSFGSYECRIFVVVYKIANIGESDIGSDENAILGSSLNLDTWFAILSMHAELPALPELASTLIRWARSIGIARYRSLENRLSTGTVLQFYAILITRPFPSPFSVPLHVLCSAFRRVSLF